VARKTVPEMTYAVSSGMLNLSLSLSIYINQLQLHQVLRHKWQTTNRKKHLIFYWYIHYTTSRIKDQRSYIPK